MLKNQLVFQAFFELALGWPFNKYFLKPDQTCTLHFFNMSHVFLQEQLMSCETAPSLMIMSKA